VAPFQSRGVYHVSSLANTLLFLPYLLQNITTPKMPLKPYTHTIK